MCSSDLALAGRRSVPWTKQSVSSYDVALICTEHDNVDYAELSDFFYIWLRRILTEIYPQLFGTLLVPKAQELVAASHRFKGDRQQAKRFFEAGLSGASGN